MAAGFPKEERLKMGPYQRRICFRKCPPVIIQNEQNKTFWILTGGSAVMEFPAAMHKKPCLHVDLDKWSIDDPAFLVKSRTGSHNLQVLNIAGPRARKDPAIYQTTLELLEAVFRGAV